MSSEPIRGTSQIPQPVRQSTRMPATLPTLGESAVTGSTAARRVALQQFAEGMDTWWRKARAAIQNDYEELASSASSAITAASDSASALRTEIQERITQNETIVAQIQALVLNSGNSRVFIQTEAPDSPALYDTWFDTDDDFHEYVYGGAAWVDVRDRAISGAIAAVGTEQVARMNADSVLSGRIDTVVTRMTNAETGITGLNTAIDAVQTTVTAQGESITAQGARITSLESSVNTANTGLLARVATIEGTYATDTEVSAAIASEVSARNGAISSAVSTETSARVAADGAIHARWGVAIDVNGAVVGRVQLDGTNQTSAFTVDASKFTVWNGTAAVPPFQVIGGQVRVANLSLISADITDRSLANIDSAAATKLGGIAAGADVTLNAINGGLKITSGGVTLAGTGSIKSSNFAAGSAGWSISAAGDAEFNSIILRNPLLYYPLATPTISPSQVFASSLAITATAAAGATIRYSTGGSVTATSTEWPKSGQNYTTLTITDSATLRVRAFNGTQQSDEVIATYTKNTTVRPNLTNDTCVCPSAADGSNPVLTQAVTTMEVFLGSTDDSAGWTYTATPSAGVTGALAGRTWTTTGFTSDTGYVDISAAKSGIGTVVERFNLSKAKAGAPGAGAFTLVNDAGCAVGPDWIQRTSVFTGMLDAAAHSLQSYVGGAFLSFNGAQVNANLAVGLTSDPATNTSYDSIDFCWVLWSSGYCAVLTNGTQVSGIAAYTTSTVFSIAYDGKQVQFLMDGAVRHTVAATSGLGLYLDTSFYNASAKVTNITFGPQGAAGADSTAYWLTSSTSTLKLSGTTFTPANITFTARSQTGTGAPGDYAGRFVISESTDGTTFTNVYTSAANEATVTRTPSAGIKSLRARLYLAGGTASLIDEETVPVVTDGTDGTNGATVLGTVGGSGSASPNNTWANITTFASAVTAPAGTRLITFSGMAVNSSGAANSIDVAIYVGNQYIALGAISVAAGGMRSVNLIATPTMASPGTLYVDMAVRGTTGNQIVLSGTLVIQ